MQLCATVTSLRVSGSLSLLTGSVRASMHLLHLLSPRSPTRLTMANPTHSLPSGLRACSAQFQPEWMSKALFSTLVPSGRQGPEIRGGRHPDMTQPNPVSGGSYQCHPEVRQEGREPLPHKVGESILLSRSGGEMGLR